MASPCATWLITFNAEKFGTRYAMAVTSHPPAPCVILAKPRRSSARLPDRNGVTVRHLADHIQRGEIRHQIRDGGNQPPSCAVRDFGKAAQIFRQATRSEWRHRAPPG